MMKKGVFITTTFILNIILFSACATTSTARKEKMGKYSYWLKEEVALLITEEEEKEFMNLMSDKEKERFMEIFWAKRDPTPRTKENEFKEEWYRRLEYVQKNFTQGPEKGWHCDMGKVYMFLGPPARVRSVQPRKQIEDSGADQMEPSATIWVKESYQEWIYPPMPDLGLEGPFSVIFRKYSFAGGSGIRSPQGLLSEDHSGYSLDQQTPKDILHALEIFPQVVIFNPFLESLQRPKFFLDKESFEGKLINDFIATGKEVRRIPLQWKPIFTRASSDDIYLSLMVRIDAQNLDKDKLREMTFFGKLKGTDEGEQEFLQPVTTEETEKGGLLATFGFPAKPGRYTLYLGARGEDREQRTLLKSELDIPDFWNGELNASSLILSPEVVTDSGLEGERGFSPFRIGQYEATPFWGNVFKRDEFLNILFHIYNARLEDDAVSLKVEYFIISEEAGYRLNPQVIEEKLEAGKTIAGGTQVSLSPLKPDQYIFKVRITDLIAEKSIERETEFIVE
jgi:GWxTD domain-containing protein